MAITDGNPGRKGNIQNSLVARELKLLDKDLTQEWLAEIEGLRQQLAELQNARNEAWESAEKWRKLYNTEAEQHRTDNQLAQQVIASLNGQLQKIKGIDEGTLTDTNSAIQAEVVQLQSVCGGITNQINCCEERTRSLNASIENC